MEPEKAPESLRLGAIAMGSSSQWVKSSEVAWPQNNGVPHTVSFGLYWKYRCHLASFSSYHNPFGSFIQPLLGVKWTKGLSLVSFVIDADILAAKPAKRKRKACKSIICVSEKKSFLFCLFLWEKKKSKIYGKKKHKNKRMFWRIIHIYLYVSFQEEGL